MAEYELYCFAQSGNAYRAALTLNLAAPLSEPAQGLAFSRPFPPQKPTSLLSLLRFATEC
jgi:hypothetical protein